MTDELDNLRQEVRSALGAMVRADVCRDSVPTDAFDIIRDELLRLADENARLNKIESLATEQRLQMEDVELYLMDVSQPDDEDAPWCDRMKSAIELLVQDWNYAVGQKNKAEAELAALKARIEGAPRMIVALLPYTIELRADHSANDAARTSILDGKRVRLVVEE